jgi:hypothetical protein
MNKFVISLLSLGLIFVSSNCVAAKDTPTSYNCLTREVWTPEKQARCKGVEVMKNTTYNIPDFGVITLENGSYQSYDSESESEISGYLDTKFIIFNDLNNDGQEESIGILWLKGGISGEFAYLVVVSQGGEHLGNAFLGDRLKPLNLGAKGEIIINMIIQGHNDPYPNPTLEVINTYILENNSLNLISTTQINPTDIRENYVAIDLNQFDYPLVGDDLEQIVWSIFAPPEEEREGNIEENIEVNLDNPSSPTVTITQLNLADDSVFGMRHLFQFEPTLNAPKWRLVWVGYQTKCQPNRGHQFWSKELCF